MNTNKLNNLQPTTNIFIRIIPKLEDMGESVISLKDDVEQIIQMRALPYSERPVSVFLRGDILINQLDGNVFELQKVLQKSNPEIEAIRSEGRLAAKLAMIDQLPIWCPCCQLRYDYAQGRYYVNKYSYLMDVDVLRTDNAKHDFGDLKREIAELPQVAYCGDATNGEDFFFIVPITCPQRYEEHAAALIRRFAAAGVRVRVNPSVSHYRTWSCDPLATKNNNAKTFDIL